MIHEITSDILSQLLSNGQVLLIDVREPGEHKDGHIPGSRLMPLSSFDPSLIEDEGKEVVFYCRSGRRSLEAAKRFGKKCSHLKSGFLGWLQG